MSNFLPPIVAKLTGDISGLARMWTEAQAVQRAGAAALERGMTTDAAPIARRANEIGERIGQQLAGPIRRALDLTSTFRESVRRFETTHAGLFSRLLTPLRNMGDRLGASLKSGFLHHVNDMGRSLASVFATDGRAGFILNSLKGFGRMVGSLFPGGQRGMAVGITSLVYGLAQLIAAIGPVIGIFNLLPALIYSGAAALTTLILAFKGFGGAVSAGLAGDMEKFHEAMAKLAPAAQVAVRQVISLRQEAKSLQLTVQQNFFAPWATQIGLLGRVYLPLLRQALGGVALDLGNVVRRIIDWLRASKTIDQMRQMFADMRYSLHNMLAILPGFIEGFTNLARAAMGPLAAMTAGWEKLGQRFADWTAKLESTGRLEEILNNATAALQVMWDILKPIGSLLSLLTQALNEAGGAAGGILVSVLNSLVAFLKTAEGFAAVVSIFEVLNQIFLLIGHVIGELLKLALPLFNALRPGLDLLIQALTIVVDALAAGLLPAVTAVAKALEPFLTLLGEQLVVLATALAPILEELGTLLGEVLISALESLLPALMDLLPVLVQTFVALLPVIIPLLRILADLIVIQGPFISVMARLLSALLIPALHLLVLILTPVVGFLEWLARVIHDNVGPTVALGNALATAAFQAETWRKVGEWLAGIWQKAKELVTSLGPTVKQAVSDAGSWLVQAGRDVIEGLKNGFLERWGSAVNTIRSFGGAIINAFNMAVGNRSPSRVFHDAGRNITAGLTRGINSTIGDVVAAVRRLSAHIVLSKTSADAHGHGLWEDAIVRGGGGLPAPTAVRSTGTRGGGFGGSGGGGGGYGSGSGSLRGGDFNSEVIRLLTEIRDALRNGLTLDGNRVSAALAGPAQRAANRNSGISGLG